MARELPKIDSIKRNQVGTYLLHMIPFNAGTARGRVMKRKLYEVWSYDTLIGRVDMTNRDVPWHKNRCRRGWRHRWHRAG